MLFFYFVKNVQKIIDKLNFTLKINYSDKYFARTNSELLEFKIELFLVQ